MRCGKRAIPLAVKPREGVNEIERSLGSAPVKPMHLNICHPSSFRIWGRMEIFEEIPEHRRQDHRKGQERLCDAS